MCERVKMRKSIFWIFLLIGLPAVHFLYLISKNEEKILHVPLETIRTLV